ncbi:alpha/beta hydrolase-fold protein [Antrihabitans sp. YC2-6]|uniref:alpha/beta hydrolase-fold protein n=1 Tax=Antrihabitans sp. YC2-6 TaxID=2799498 RepID=UPI0018F3140A|nr:alpha/beta hydrolase-fold protein [Antrihabitans sp. YC2-6]MBJ8346247.1 esterase [Antrihabitans sp. YC2-6]
MLRAPGSRSRRLGLCAALLVVPLAAGLTTATASAVPAPHTAPGFHAAPAGGATITRVDWLDDRRVALWINSPSMATPVQVQLLLARDWNTRPDAKFPALIMLDGLRAQDGESGWTLDAKAQPFYADKNVNVVLPIGGQSSFYSDWLQPDNGKNYKWETFLTQELPPLLEGQWRTTDVRGVAGLSMGGTSAMFLAARNPGFVKYAASYSGFLTTTSLGMPQAIQYAMNDAGGFNSGAMWGPPTSPQWAAHDPFQLAEKLRGLSIYVSSGSGSTGPYDAPSAVPGISTNFAGMGLEILSRLTSQNFATKLNKLSIPAQINYRPSGTHSWPYWDFEMRQSWPQAATALGTEVEKPACGQAGAIGGVVGANGWIGDCLTGEYSVAGGIAQDFRFGRVFFSQATGPQIVSGRIGGAYQANGGPAGPLGLPVSAEQGAPDGRGRFQLFQHGSIYWTPQTGAHAIRGAILDEWGKQGFEAGPLGYPVAEEVKTPNKDGIVQGFEIGAMYFNQATGAKRVQGLIFQKYGSLGYEDSWLGFPKSNEVAVKDFGKFNEFEGGNIYWSPLSGAWSIKNGPIFEAWKSVGYENGRLGFPTGDQFDIPGGVQQNFQLGYITFKDGKAEVH